MTSAKEPPAARTAWRAPCSSRSRSRSMPSEVTDKGSINQHAVLARRAHLVEELYTRPYSPRVLVAATGG